MKNLFIYSLSAVMLIAFLAFQGPVPAGTEEGIPAAGDNAILAAEGNNAFALDFYSVLSSEEGNIFFSPYSISLAFAMLYAGAADTTGEQIANTMHYSLEQEQLHSALSEISGIIENASQDNHTDLNIANGMWAQNNYSFKSEYLDLLETWYSAEISPVDFLNAPEAAVSRINDWAKTQTNNTIPQVISIEDITPLTVFVLANAVYFKGKWKYMFDESETDNETFYLSDGQEIQVPMMKAEGEFRAMDNTTFEMVEMPYAGNRLAMFVIVPAGDEGIASLEASLAVGEFETWISKLVSQNMTVSFPKFSVGKEIDVKTVLEQLGMSDAFVSGTADFSEMEPAGQIYLTDAFQKAWISVDESGTEAGAITVGVVGCSMLPAFRVNHPFLFLIRDSVSGTIIFIGRVENPLGS